MINGLGGSVRRDGMGRGVYKIWKVSDEWMINGLGGCVCRERE